MTILKAAVLIDVGYFNKILEHHKVRVDYTKFCEFLVAQIGLDDSHPKTWRWRTYIYDGMLREPKASDDERYRGSYHKKREFLLKLGDLPRFHVRVGKTKVSEEHGLSAFRQKRVDMMLGVDITRIATSRQADVIILVAGDSDFVPAVLVAREEGALVYLWHGSNNTLEPRSFDELRQVCDQAQEVTRVVLEQCKRPEPLKVPKPAQPAVPQPAVPQINNP